MIFLPNINKKELLLLLLLLIYIGLNILLKHVINIKEKYVFLDVVWKIILIFLLKVVILNILNYLLVQKKRIV